MERMSVTRALAELKKVDDRIQREVQNGQFIGIAVGQKDLMQPKGLYRSMQEMENKIRSSFQTVEGLIDRRAKLKSAIVMSNANTNVTIGGRSMTVAEAIEFKTSIAQQVVFANTLRNQYVNANRAVEENNKLLDATIEKNLATIYGNDKGKVDTAQYEAIAAPQKKNKEASVYDPMGLVSKLEALEATVRDVQTELDFILSESNARTEIVLN